MARSLIGFHLSSRILSSKWVLFVNRRWAQMFDRKYILNLMLLYFFLFSMLVCNKCARACARSGGDIVNSSSILSNINHACMFRDFKVLFISLSTSEVLPDAMEFPI